MDVRQRIAAHWGAGDATKDAKAELDRLWGDQAPSLRQIQRVYKKCAEEGPADTAVDRVKSRCGKGPRAKRTRTKDAVAQVRQLLDDDRRYTVRQIAETLDLNYMTVHRIISKDLQMKKICARWVPRLLTPEHKARRVECARAWLRQCAAWRYQVVSGDETWIHYETPETKAQSKQWRKRGEKAPRKARRSASAKKVMLTAFFDGNGAIYLEYASQTINSERYIETLRHLRENIRKKRHHLLDCLLYTSPSPRDRQKSRMPSSA